jgi:DNA-directed RNA polymerase specialized sigma24 family protein
MAGDEGSISQCFAGLKAGDRSAAIPLWDHYFARMSRLARATLRGASPCVAADEEDAALSAFESFCAGAEDGRFAQVNGREDLWRLLAVITVRKARALNRHQRRLKRGGGGVVRESDLNGASGGVGVFDGVASPLPGPEVAVLAGEELARLLNLLNDETLQKVTLWRLDGLTCEEIATRLGCARRTVSRQLDLIRKIWTAHDEGNAEP